MVKVLVGLHYKHPAEYNKEVRLQDERIKLFIDPEDDLCLLSEPTATTLLLINNEVIIILPS